MVSRIIRSFSHILTLVVILLNFIKFHRPKASKMSIQVQADQIVADANEGEQDGIEVRSLE